VLRLCGTPLSGRFGRQEYGMTSCVDSPKPKFAHVRTRLHPRLSSAAVHARPHVQRRSGGLIEIFLVYGSNHINNCQIAVSIVCLTISQDSNARRAQSPCITRQHMGLLHAFLPHICTCFTLETTSIFAMTSHITLGIFCPFEARVLAVTAEFTDRDDEGDRCFTCRDFRSRVGKW
jgi:hypothetical protein